MGLILSVLVSVFDAFTNISRKKVLDRQYDAALISFWCKFVAFFAFGVGILVLLIMGVPPQLPDIGARLGIPPSAAFLIFLLLNAVLEGTAILLSLRALQVSPISLCMPFMAMTPLFLLPAGKFLLHESISGGMVIGVVLIAIGSLVVNRQAFAQGFFEPLKAIFRERGSRYMLIVALLLTVTNVLDKFFVISGGDVTFQVKLARSLTLSTGKCVMLALFFVGLTTARLGDWNSTRQSGGGLLRLITGFNWGKVWTDVPVWMVLAGLLEAVLLVLQLTAMQYIPAALVISVKRTSIVLSVFLGWAMFHERGITDRVIASFVMLAGVFIFFLTQPNDRGFATLDISGALAVAAVALVGMSVALYVTRNHYKETRD